MLNQSQPLASGDLTPKHRYLSILCEQNGIINNTLIGTKQPTNQLINQSNDRYNWPGDSSTNQPIKFLAATPSECVHYILNILKALHATKLRNFGANWVLVDKPRINVLISQ